MEKKGRLIFTIAFIVIFSALNIFLFVNKGTISYTGISGKFMQEIPRLPLNLNISIIFFIALWILLFAIIFVSFAHFLKTKKEEKIKINLDELSKNGGKSKTDLDTLYNLLKQKKALKVGTIARIFKISNENALEWSKILENHELVVIDYPTFNEPEVKIYEKEVEEKEKQTQEREKQAPEK
ncbi:MAG: hypothetical protein WC584_05600, partial [Candidatus Pacearchaeota archaeon]